MAVWIDCSVQGPRDQNQRRSAFDIWQCMEKPQPSFEQNPEAKIGECQVPTDSSIGARLFSLSPDPLFYAVALHPVTVWLRQIRSKPRSTRTDAVSPSVMAHARISTTILEKATLCYHPPRAWTSHNMTPEADPRPMFKATRSLPAVPAAVHSISRFQFDNSIESMTMTRGLRRDELARDLFGVMCGFYGESSRRLEIIESLL
ncbi:hypothetical protein V8F33_004070 [Rhypophila sp. PSN 637]